MSDHGDGNVLELSSGELEGENIISSKFKYNHSSDSIPLIMGLNAEYCNNGGTGTETLGLNLLQNFDESNIFQCDVSGVFEWIRQRTDSVSSADLDCMRIDCNEAVIATSELTSTNEEPVCVSSDIDNTVTIDSTFPASVSNNLSVHSDSLNVSLLDDLTCLQSDEQLAKSESENIISESVFQYTLPPKSICKPVTATGNSDILLKQSDSLSKELLSSELTKVKLVRNTGSLPFVKVPKKCILSGKIIKKEACALITKSILPTLLDQTVDIPQTVEISQNTLNDSETVQVNFSSEPVNDSSFENSEEIGFMLTEDQLKTPYVDESLVKDDNLPSTVGKDREEKAASKTVVAISTNKLEDVTEIKIKTVKGEELYKGKASELLKATNLLLKSDLNIKEGYKLKLDKSDVANKDTDSDLSITVGNEPVTSEDEPITEAFKELGISSRLWAICEIIKGQQGLWMCPLEQCNSLFNKLSSLKIHILMHYKLRPFKCDYTGCEWSFYTNSRLKRHKETHLRKKEFKCPFESCNRSFTTIYNLHTHLKLHQRPADLLCPVSGCGKAFQTRRNMESHLKEHGNEHAPYVCDVAGCEKRYYSPSALQSHSRTHLHNIEDLQCEYCFKMFDKPCRLKAHLRSHTGVKPYKCNYEGCEWAFTTSSKLNRHQAKHTQERRFLCSLCCKAFLRSEHLKDHMLIHYLTRSFVCPISGCGQQFSAKSSLYVHIKKHRKKEGNLEGGDLQKDSELISILPEMGKLSCSIEGCKHVFSSKNEIASHMQACHKKFKIEVRELNALDSIELMNGDDNLISLEGLQFKNDNSSSTGLSLTNPEGIVAEYILPDLPEYISDDLTGLSVLNSSINEAEFSDSAGTSSKETSNCDIALNSLTTIAPKCTEIGSARTGITYQDVLSERDLRKSLNKKSSTSGRKRLQIPSESLLKDNSGLQVTSDVVLTAGLLGGSQDSLTRGLMFQDELPNGDLYECITEESGLADNNSNGDGELLHVFIFESADVRNPEFEQSTINLRDLE